MKKIILLLCIVGSLFAHKLNLFVFDENNHVIASAYFASGTYCNGCKIDVYDENHKLLEEGKTNEKGEYVVQTLKPKLIIKAEALGGHAAQSEFEVKNLQDHNKEVKDNTLIQSLLAALVLALIFLALKRIKK